MKNLIAIYHRLTLLVLLGLVSSSLAAQKPKMLIVPVEDTTLVNCHVGFTAFKNSVDTLEINVPLGKYIENKLREYLCAKFEVDIAYPTPEIARKPYGLFGTTKEFKQWLAENQKGYDYLILIRNIDIAQELMNAPIPKSTSGFYSRGKLHGVYSSIGFKAYKIANNKELEYYEAHKAFSNIKDFKMPKDKGALDNESLEIIKAELLKHQDERIKYFLANSYLMPDLK